jgi:LPXTG-motif cell wall-anchored protein
VGKVIRTGAARVAFAGVLVAAGLVVIAAPASASTFEVTNANPSGAGSLSNAIDQANAHAGADTITFASTLNGVTLPEPASTIEAGGPLTITGNGPPKTKVDGEINIDSDSTETTTVTISGVTVGDFNINSGNDSTTNVTISDSAVNSDGIDINSGFGSKTITSLSNVNVVGGDSGIDVNGEDSTTTVTIANSTVNGVDAAPLDVEDASSTATVTSSTFSNSSDAVFVGDGATLHMTNSTVSGNGGDEADPGIDSSGTVTLQNVTVTKNDTGGIIAEDGTFDITNTIIAGNGPSIDGECEVDDGTLTSHGGNLSDDTSCNPISTDHKGTPANLGPLANNGGPTMTHLPLTGSDAIDGGVATGCPKTDQRGVSRPQDGNNDGVAVCDVGAVEIAGKSAPPTTGETTTSTPASAESTPASSATTPTTVAAAAELPRTGSSSTTPLAILGFGLVAAGAALASRRRRIA